MVLSLSLSLIIAPEGSFAQQYVSITLDGSDEKKCVTRDNCNPIQLKKLPPLSLFFSVYLNNLKIYRKHGLHKTDNRFRFCDIFFLTATRVHVIDTHQRKERQKILKLLQM